MSHTNHIYFLIGTQYSHLYTISLVAFFIWSSHTFMHTYPGTKIVSFHIPLNIHNLDIDKCRGTRPVVLVNDIKMASLAFIYGYTRIQGQQLNKYTFTGEQHNFTSC